MARRLWDKEELLLGINLYTKLAFGQLHSRHPQIIELAKLLGRTPGSIALKLVNFASLDPKQKDRGIKGMANSGKLTEDVWAEFYNNWDKAFLESEQLLARRKHTTLEKLYGLEVDAVPQSGKMRKAEVMVRVNQHLFRAVVMANYNGQCCITGMNNPELLTASHIVPWSVDSKNRLNPANGLLLNPLHDKAFDKYLITVTTEYKVKVAKRLLREKKNKAIKENFIQLENTPIRIPRKFLPDESYLLYHNKIFNKLNV